MNRNKRSIPLGKGYSISLDRREIFPDDPGAGTPAMVYGPFGKSATFFCALDTGEVSDGNGEDFDIPQSVYRKMEKAIEAVDAFLDGKDD